MAARISLCMIVRDEAQMLPRFLEQAKGVWDELIAVDTGSLDSTPALLEAAGARVLHTPWRDDFAAARNVGLEQASGDFILVLDADERVPASLGPALRAAAEDRSIGAATLLMQNRLPHGHVHEARLLRAFRRALGLRYRHVIHEDVSEDALAMLPARGLRLAHLPGVVEHLGYVRAHAAGKGKKERDVALLAKLIAGEPGDLYAHFKLLEQARFWRDPALWNRAALAAEEALRRAPERLASAHYGGELLALIADGLHRGEPALALEWLERFRGRALPSARLHLRRAELLESLQHPAAAAEFERSLALTTDPSSGLLSPVRPLMGLARLALAQGDLARAGARIQQALPLAPRDPEALFAAAALHHARRGAAGLVAFVELHARAHGDSRELHAAAGELAAQSGALELARAQLQLAAGDPPSGRAAHLLAQVQFALGELPGARALLSSLAAELPDARVALALCELLETGELQTAIDPDASSAQRAARALLSLVRAARNPELLERLLRAIAAASPRHAWLRPLAAL